MTEKFKNANDIVYNRNYGAILDDKLLIKVIYKSMIYAMRFMIIFKMLV